MYWHATEAWLNSCFCYDYDFMTQSFIVWGISWFSESWPKHLLTQNHVTPQMPLYLWSILGFPKDFARNAARKNVPFSQEWFLANTLAREELNDEQAERAEKTGDWGPVKAAISSVTFKVSPVVFVSLKATLRMFNWKNIWLRTMCAIDVLDTNIIVFNTHDTLDMLSHMYGSCLQGVHIICDMYMSIRHFCWVYHTHNYIWNVRFCPALWSNHLM